MASSLATDSCPCKQLTIVEMQFRLQHMNVDPKLAFSERLHQARADAGMPKRGRRIELARVVNVSGEAARKWLAGESIPAMDHIVQLSQYFRIDAQWLLTGMQQKQNGVSGTLTEEEIQHIQRLRCLSPSERARAFRVVEALMPGSEKAGGGGH